MWFGIGFGVACGLSVWLLPLWGLLLSICVGLILTVLSARRQYRRVVCALIGCVVGLCWYLGFSWLWLRPALELDGVTLEITATATGYSYDTDYGVGVDGKFRHDGKNYRIRLYVNDCGEISPGDTIKGQYNLRYTAPGGAEEPTYHAGDGILFLGYPRGRVQVLKGSVTNGYLGNRLNHDIRQRLRELFPADVEAFARALLLGDDYDLDYETDTALKVSGIRHIVAVSGLHVAILYALLRAISLNRRWLTALIGLPVLYLFAAVAQFTPSVTRACIMVGLMLLAQLIDRDYDSATALAFAGICMLVCNPLVITSVSFQMSFACVAGILLFQPSFAQWMGTKRMFSGNQGVKGRLSRWLVGSISVSVSALVLTVPLSAYYFGTVSLVSVLTNLLTLWAVTLAFYGIVAVCLVSVFWMGGAVFLAWLGAFPMRYVLTVAKILASFPLAAVYTQSVYIVLWLIFLYTLLVLFLAGRKRSGLVFSCCAGVGLCLALLLSWNEHRFSNTHFTALDVGQGQSLILHSEGRTFLIDCGGSNDKTAADTAAETLLSRGITHLDGIILTHGDRDHAGGLGYLLSRVDADFLMHPSTTAPETLAQLTENWDGRLICVEEDWVLQLDHGKIHVFAPIFGAETNENSLCILFESKKCAILVTGDRSSLGEMLLMHDAALPDVDLLVAGHHGSKYSTSEELLKTVSPETVFISVGRNSYGHPARELLDRLEAFGCRIFRTDVQGTLIFRR